MCELVTRDPWFIGSYLVARLLQLGMPLLSLITSPQVGGENLPQAGHLAMNGR